MVTQSNEILDIYDVNKQPTGRTMIRHKYKLEPGEYTLTGEAIIINRKGEIFITKRSHEKQAYPDFWECGSGAIGAGEESKPGTIRELYEETGIDLSNDPGFLFNTIKRTNQFKDIYVFLKDFDVSQVDSHDGEVVDAKWVTPEEFQRMFDNNEIVPNVDFDAHQYKKAIYMMEQNGIR